MVRAINENSTKKSNFNKKTIKNQPKNQNQSGGSVKEISSRVSLVEDRTGIVLDVSGNLTLETISKNGIGNIR